VLLVHRVDGVRVATELGSEANSKIEARIGWPEASRFAIRDGVVAPVSLTLRRALEVRPQVGAGR